MSCSYYYLRFYFIRLLLISQRMSEEFQSLHYVLFASGVASNYLYLQFSSFYLRAYTHRADCHSIAAVLTMQASERGETTSSTLTNRTNKSFSPFCAPARSAHCPIAIVAAQIVPHRAKLLNDNSIQLYMTASSARLKRARLKYKCTHVQLVLCGAQLHINKESNDNGSEE